MLITSHPLQQAKQLIGALAVSSIDNPPFRQLKKVGLQWHLSGTKKLLCKLIEASAIYQLNFW